MKKFLMKGLMIAGFMVMLSGVLSSVDAMGQRPPGNRPPGGGGGRPTPVPEPSTLALLGAGVAGAGAYVIAKIRKKK